jgi:integrase
MKVDLSDRFIAALKPDKKPTDYFDTHPKARGLNLRVMPSGIKTWSLLFTSPKDGKRARLSLGTYPATSLATARTRVIEARGKIEAGTDPREEKKNNDGPMTVAMLAAKYEAMHLPKLRGGSEIKRKLAVDILPVIGSVTLAELHRRDIHRVLDKIKERGSLVMAEKTHTDLRAMLSWGVSRGYLDHNPAAGMDERVSKPRERYLSEAEIAALWPALATTFKKPVELALKLALVTGQRIGEVCAMTEDQLDLTNRTWTIPAEISKNGNEHKVPLSDMALALIEEARANANGKLIKQSYDAIGHMLGYRMDKLPVNGWRAHDLRRTVCTHLAKMSFPPLIIGAVVNHRSQTKQGITLGTYVQYDYAKEKREALDAWAERLQGIITGKTAKIIPLPVAS